MSSKSWYVPCDSALEWSVRPMVKVQLKIRRFNPEKDVENLSKAARAKIEEEAESLGGFLKTPSEIKLGKVEVDLEEHGPIYYLWTPPRRAVNADDVSGLGSKRENKRVPRLRRELKNGWEMAPRPGLEPGTLRLTAECSTIELPRSTRSRGKLLSHPITLWVEIPGSARREPVGPTTPRVSYSFFSESPAVPPLMASLNSRIPFPRPLPSSGNFPGPKMSRTINNMKKMWVG